MSILSIEQARKEMEYIELLSTDERQWVENDGLTTSEVNFFDTIEHQHDEIIELKLRMKVYHGFINDMCKTLLESANEYGMCEMKVNKKLIKRLVESLPKIN